MDRFAPTCIHVPQYGHNMNENAHGTGKAWNRGYSFAMFFFFIPAHQLGVHMRIIISNIIMVRGLIQYGMRYSAIRQFFSTTALHLLPRGFCTLVPSFMEYMYLFFNPLTVPGELTPARNKNYYITCHNYIGTVVLSSERESHSIIMRF